MHLGLIDGPFVPHNLVSTQESPVSLPRFQMASRLKILISSGSKKGSQLYYPFLSKSPGKRIPSILPNVVRMERDNRLQGMFTSLLIYLFNSKALRKERPSTFPKSEAPMETDANSRALLNISFGFSSTGAPPPEALSTEPLQTETLHSYSLIHPSLKVRSRRDPYQFPLAGPLWKEMPVSRAFSAYPPGSPGRAPSLHVPFTEFPLSEMPYLQSPFQPSLKVPGRRTVPGLPN